MTSKPLLFLDVNGVLNPEMGGRNNVLNNGYRLKELMVKFDGDRKHHLIKYAHNSSHNEQLQLLSNKYDIVWASKWGEKTNLHISPLYDLGTLPYVQLSSEPRNVLKNSVGGLCYKTGSIVEYADGKDFVWVDDLITSTDRGFLLSKVAGKTFGYKIDRRVGLTGKDVSILLGFTI